MHAGCEAEKTDNRLYVQMYIPYEGQTSIEDHSFYKHCIFMSTFGQGTTVTMETKNLRHTLWQSYLKNCLC